MRKYKTVILTTLLSIAPLSSSFANECIYSPKIIKNIASGSRYPDASIDTKQSVAFKSNDFKKLYFIAARINSDAFKPSIGIWTVNGIESGMIFSVNTDAKITTVFPDGEKSGPKIKKSDHGYNEVTKCFNKKFKLK